MAMNNTSLAINIFNAEKIAVEESFIGRKKLISDLIMFWNESDGNGTYSVVGLNRMGKSSFVHEMGIRIKKIDPSAICVILCLGNRTWPELIQTVMQTILLNENAVSQEVKNFCKKACETDLKNKLNENVLLLLYNNMLTSFSKSGQHFFLAIDEFDAARFCWKDKYQYFEGLRDSVQLPGFFMLVSRRPLEVIETESYGNSCFHNVFREIHICAFEGNTDMKEYYQILSERYGIELDEDEREKVEEYTGFCPTLLAGLGNRLASSAINHITKPAIEEIFSEKSFQLNYRKHYDEFLKRMIYDGSWDELVQCIMGISSIRIDSESEDTFHEAGINKLCCRGYLRKKTDDQYVVFSDDFSAWAKHKLFRNEIDTIYKTLIMAETAIKDMLRKQMPEIWARLHPGCDWNDDFLNDTPNVPVYVRFFTKPHPPKDSDVVRYLKTAREFESAAEVADALSINVKLILVEKLWKDGIKSAFNSEPYSKWKDSFELIKKVRNPLFHAMFKPDASSDNYFLLKDVNEHANRIITQLS